MAQAQFHRTDYGSDHHHKPTKAIIGVAIMIVFAFALYEFDGNKADTHPSAQASQTIASSTHR